uniref:F-box-like protein n=1 Tax=Pithovirus LCPAC406 TaxID=2506599 RepID=A0A481ZDU9_9VIRU|nr:MAG: F-box-like protein [Pithovirus LCPAC406]
MNTVNEILGRIHLKEESLGNLPPDVIQEIFLDLSVEEIMKLCRSSIAFNIVCERESFWQTKVWTDFGIEKKYWDTWRKTAENLFKIKMINLNKKWINGMTYREIIDKIANRTEFEAEEKLNINRSMIHGDRIMGMYGHNELRDFITELGETPIVMNNNRFSLINQLDVILNINIAGLVDLQLQYLPSSILLSKRTLIAMIGHYYHNHDQLESLATELLGRELTDEEFEIVQNTLTREFTIILLAAHRYKEDDRYASKGHYLSLYTGTLDRWSIPENNRHSEGFDLLHDLLDTNLFIMSYTPYSDETLYLLINKLILRSYVTYRSPIDVSKSIAPKYNTLYLLINKLILRSYVTNRSPIDVSKSIAPKYNTF